MEINDMQGRKRISDKEDAMTFPKELDGAKVLYFTPEGDYGVLEYDTGGIASHFKYLAICKYANCDGYYLFCCNERKEVETDSLWDSAKECMEAADDGHGKNIVWFAQLEQ
ncbi:MAG: hypothetical protein NC417_05750 [Candidatus Gastranaerophilales bacterium]|nr:hypothetical protein [Candidatus Gastranaerophilales bacterium]